MKPAISFDAFGEIWLWEAKHCAYVPWTLTDAIHTPQFKAFVADAIAKEPVARTEDEKRAIRLAMGR